MCEREVVRGTGSESEKNAVVMGAQEVNCNRLFVYYALFYYMKRGNFAGDGSDE